MKLFTGRQEVYDFNTANFRYPVITLGIKAGGFRIKYYFPFTAHVMLYPVFFSIGNEPVLSHFLAPYQ